MARLILFIVYTAPVIVLHYYIMNLNLSMLSIASKVHIHVVRILGTYEFLYFTTPMTIHAFVFATMLFYDMMVVFHFSFDTAVIMYIIFFCILANRYNMTYIDRLFHKYKLPWKDINEYIEKEVYKR